MTSIRSASWSRRLIAGALAGLVIASGLAFQQAQAGRSSGYGWVGPRDIVEDPRFAPYQNPRTHVNPRLSNGLGGRPVERADATVIGGRLGGHALRWVISGPDWGAWLLFLDRPVTSETPSTPCWLQVD